MTQTKTKEQKIRIQKKILKLNHIKYNDLSEQMKSIIYQMSNDELKLLSFYLAFDEHIEEYISDCLKLLRVFTEETKKQIAEEIWEWIVDWAKTGCFEVGMESREAYKKRFCR